VISLPFDFQIVNTSLIPEPSLPAFLAAAFAGIGIVRRRGTI
jgi:hypothetical protein